MIFECKSSSSSSNCILMTQYLIGTCIHVHDCTHACMHIHTYIYTYMHICIHAFPDIPLQTRIMFFLNFPVTSMIRFYSPTVINHLQITYNINFLGTSCMLPLPSCAQNLAAKPADGKLDKQVSSSWQTFQAHSSCPLVLNWHYTAGS